jgi:hypothetical protein
MAVDSKKKSIPKDHQHVGTTTTLKRRNGRKSTARVLRTKPQSSTRDSTTNKKQVSTIGDVLKRLLPRGTNASSAGSFAACPIWPPDVFAVAGTLVEIAGCYAEPRFTSAWNALRYKYTDEYREQIESIGSEWFLGGVPPKLLQELWTQLIGFQDRPLKSEDCTADKDDWAFPALRLMAIADRASIGMGFNIDRLKSASEQLFPFLVFEQHYEILKWATSAKRPKLYLPNIPVSLCNMVPAEEVCVQPKTNTPSVGCTLRSFSHHLALLPPRSVVAANWVLAEPGDDESDRPLNILLVPFPYVLRGENFTADPHRIDRRNGYFTINHEWLGHSSLAKQRTQMIDFVCGMVKEAEREVGTVHAIVFPEASLPSDFAELVATHLATRLVNLELFVSGTVSRGSSANPRNRAFTCRFHRVKILKGWYQSKHHRWCLNDGQIRRYHLGHALNPDSVWWEKIDVDNRTCFFSVIRPGASLVVLVCEDLARSDPVLPVINAIGPNIVVALLMDGPQLERRWPGRYATVLADDPGSAVLTLTCLGMIRRSAMPGQDSERQVALWKQPGGAAQELSLPKGDHGLVLSLQTRASEQFTFDMRSDHGGTRQFQLTAVRGVRARHSPGWMEMD